MLNNNVPVEFLKKFDEFEKELQKLVSQNNGQLYNGHINNDSALVKDLPSWKEYYYKIIDELGDISFSVDAQTQDIIRAFIKESDTYKWHLEAPYYTQIITKPYGYAGDAEMMKIIYNNEFSGNNYSSRMLHKIATECTACVAVRNRKDLITQFLLKAKGNVLSLAAGPAVEMLDILKLERAEKIKLFALDHDINTLFEAKKQDFHRGINYGIINAFNLIKGNKNYLVPRFNSLSLYKQKDYRGYKKYLIPLKYKVKELEDNTFDFIYTAGLYDYITLVKNKKRGAIALTTQLFNLLKPGGELLIGNFSDKNPIGTKWIMEFICDWFLYYRTEDEILAFASDIDKDLIESIEVIKEEKGINSFLKLKKKR